jgi:hypothetical protein
MTTVSWNVELRTVHPGELFKKYKRNTTLEHWFIFDGLISFKNYFIVNLREIPLLFIFYLLYRKEYIILQNLALFFANARAGNFRRVAA